MIMPHGGVCMETTTKFYSKIIKRPQRIVLNIILMIALIFVSTTGTIHVYHKYMDSSYQDIIAPYEAAVKNGYTGSQLEWLVSLVQEGVEGGRSAYEIALENGYTGTESQWLSSLIGQNGVDGTNGKDGINGIDGANGKSAYELAVENGFDGTLSQWLDSLVGTDGIDGKNGINGKDGKSAYSLAVANGYTGTLTQWLASLVGQDGIDGKSAYELAVENGYSGTVAEWLASLAGETGATGADGKSAYELAQENGYTGTESQWLSSLIGAKGKSAYELAVENGYIGTVSDWLLSLVGATGQDGQSAYEIAVNNGYSGTEAQWLESLVGKDGRDGIDGIDGQNGKSAYDLAVENGFNGTLAQWLDSLVGKDGIDGQDGRSAYDLAVANGYTGTLTQWLASLVGQDGIDGKSAYELAVENGYSGTVAEWLASLAGETGATGADGKSAYELAQENGYTGTESQWLSSLIGAKGKSAYELAVENGFVGTLTQWLESLKGTNGATGKSAYEVAQNNGYTGTVTEWLTSLVGATGKSAYELAVENGFEGTLTQWLNSLVGKDGQAGNDGKSAYEIAVANGYSGTEAQWLASLVGETGAAGKSVYELAKENGYTGTLSDWLNSLVGAPGETGAAGKSAYELAVENGYSGTVAEWLASLAGETGATGAAGKSAYEIARENGYTGTESQWLSSLIGANGKSAYELAVDNGYTGTLTEWLASLVGKAGTDGNNGKSAYEIAKQHGYRGSEEEWINSLTGTAGAPGKSAYELAVEKGFEGTLAQWLDSLVGQPGNGIDTIRLTASEGLMDTYTIYYTDGTTDNFTLKVAATWHTGNGTPNQVPGARIGDFYLNQINSDVYQLSTNGWVGITNIRGISITNVTVEALYDSKGKYFNRYTFSFSDGTKEVMDVYDENKAFAIVDHTFYVPVATEPDQIPNIELQIICFNSTVISVPLEAYMIQNISDVHFSTTGTYRVFIQYYNICGYITLCVLPDDPIPSEASSINVSDIIWSNNNFGSYDGLYLNVIWDRPGVLPTVVSLNNPDVTITKADGTSITENDRGQNLALKVTYLGHEFELNIYWFSNEELKHGKVLSVRYQGDVWVLDQYQVTDQSIMLADPTQYGLLAFKVYTSKAEGTYFRKLNLEFDRILTLDTEEVFDISKAIIDTIVDYDLEVCLLPGITSRYYHIDNTLPICVYSNESSNPIELTCTSVSFNKRDLLVSQHSVPEVYVTFHLNESPGTITVPLSLDMLVDPNIFKTEGKKDIEVEYHYGGYILRGTVYSVYLHDLSRITDTSTGGAIYAGDQYRYLIVSPEYKEMKCTAASDVVPKIVISAKYVRGYDKWEWDSDLNWGSPLPSFGHNYYSYIIQEDFLELTKSDILNIQYLDFSTPGNKEIKFMLNGIEHTIHIDFYDVSNGIIKDITYYTGNYYQNAIPTRIEIYDIGYLYLNVENMILYDRYSGSWMQIADLSALTDQDTIKVTTTNDSILWLQYHSTYKQLQYSLDGTYFSALTDMDSFRVSSSECPIFIGDTDPHDSVNAHDILFYIKNEKSMQLGTMLHINYYENYSHALQEDVAITTEFYQNFDLSAFIPGYIGTQNITFHWGQNYSVSISVCVEPCDSRFEEYHNLSNIADDNGNTLILLVDAERNIVGTKRYSSSSPEYHGYYVVEELSDGKELVYITNLQTVTAALAGIGESAKADRIRINYDFLYRYGFKKAIIDHKNKTIEICDEVTYTPVDLSCIADSEEINAFFRIDGDFGELFIMTDEGNMALRFFYKTYENGTVISIDDEALSSQIGYFYLVQEGTPDNEIYRAYVGRWGTKYSITPDEAGIAPGSVTGLGVVLCDDNRLYLTYDGIQPDDIYLLDYAIWPDGRIYILDEKIIAELDQVNMEIHITTNPVYDVDISVLNDFLDCAAIITIGTDTMILEVTGTDMSRSYEFYYFEFEENKFDLHLTNGNSVDDALRQQLNDCYIELHSGEMIMRNDPVEKVYTIDYSAFLGFPKDISPADIRTAQLRISTKESLMTILINGEDYYHGTYIYDSILNAIIPEDFYKTETLMFSFELVSDSTVKMYDLLPGEEFSGSMDAYLDLVQEDITVLNSFVRLNAQGLCCLYAELQIFDSSTSKYVPQTLTLIARYRWVDDNTLLLLDPEDLEPLALHLTRKNSSTLELRIGNIDSVAVYMTPEKDAMIFYKSGVVSCSQSFGLVEFAFYEYLDEDTVLVTTIFGIGVIYDIENGQLVLNENYPDKNPDYECVLSSKIDEAGLLVYKHKESGKLLIKYVAEEPGNGLAVTSYYCTGETINDHISYCSFLVFTDLLLYHFDGQYIMFAGELNL